MKSMENYERRFDVSNYEKVIIHTWKNPYPEMFFINENKEKKDKKKEIKDEKNNNKNKINNNINNEKEKISLIKGNLSCFILKSDFLEEPNIILGYPIVKTYINYIYPIPELLSYEGFMEELSRLDNLSDNIFLLKVLIINVIIIGNQFI